MCTVPTDKYTFLFIREEIHSWGSPLPECEETPRKCQGPPVHGTASGGPHRPDSQALGILQAAVRIPSLSPAHTLGWVSGEGLGGVEEPSWAVKGF